MLTLARLAFFAVLIPSIPAFAGPCRIFVVEPTSGTDNGPKALTEIVSVAHGYRGHHVVRNREEADRVIELDYSIETKKGIFGERDHHIHAWKALDPETGKELLSVKKSECATLVDQGCWVFDGNTHRLPKFLGKLSCSAKK